MTGIEIQRVGDGILCEFEGGASVWFNDRMDAALFAANLTMVARFGRDSIDDATEPPKIATQQTESSEPDLATLIGSELSKRMQGQKATQADLSASGAESDHGGRGDGEGLCHCGQPIVWHDYQQPPITRGLCAACDDVRCDAYPGACKR